MKLDLEQLALILRGLSVMESRARRVLRVNHHHGRETRSMKNARAVIALVERTADQISASIK